MSDNVLYAAYIGISLLQRIDEMEAQEATLGQLSTKEQSDWYTEIIALKKIQLKGLDLLKK